MMPVSDDQQPSNRALRRWGPIGVIAVIAVVVIVVLVATSGGDDDDEAGGATTAAATDETTAPAATTVDTTAPTGTAETSEEGTADEGAAATTVPTTDDGGSGDEGDGSGGDVPVPLSFSEAEEQGIEVDWGDRCDPEYGRVAMPYYFRGECYAPFEGDNGGETDVGVTADSIKIVVYRELEGDPILAYLTDALAIDDTNQEEFDTIAGFTEIFESYYETYGRSIDLELYEGTGLASDEVAARADAVRIAEEIQPFAVWGGPILTNAFADELAARGVLCLSCGPTQPSEWYQERAPYVWSIDMSTLQKQTHGAEFVLKQLAGKTAEFAGDAIQGQDRSFGLLYLESSDTSKELADEFTATLADGGVELAETVAFALDPATIQASASQAVARFKAAGVTTILFSGDAISPRDFTREATAQDYYPEWVLVAPALTDTTAFARTYDQEQWAHAFGVTALSARVEPSSSGFYQLYDWYFGEEAPAADQIGVLAPYPSTFISQLQAVGPDLTKENWARVLQSGVETIPAVTAPYLSWGDLGIWPYPDYNGIDDITFIWWDPTISGPDERRNEAEGMWQYADGGTRYLPGDQPDASGLFDPATSVAIFDEPPADEQPPDYPSPT